MFNLENLKLGEVGKFRKTYPDEVNEAFNKLLAIAGKTTSNTSEVSDRIYEIMDLLDNLYNEGKIIKK